MNGRVEDAVVAGNDVAGCGRGLVVAGAFSWEEAGGAVRGTSVGGVLIKDNRFHTNTTAIHVSAGLLMYTRLWGRSPTNTPAAGQVVTGNIVRDVVLERNELVANGTAFLVTGASVIDTNGHVVTGNLVQRVAEHANLLRDNQRNCVVIHNHSHNSVGVNMDNSVVDGPCPADR